LSGAGSGQQLDSCSTRPIGQIWNFPLFTASSTSSRNIRSSTFAAGIITPCVPLRPSIRHVSKNPSIFSLTRRSPVYHRAGSSNPSPQYPAAAAAPRAPIAARKISVELALSPSTPEYDCSKQMLAASDSGLSFAKQLRKYPAMMCTPLSWNLPLRFASRLDIDESRLAQRRARRDAHRLSERIPPDLHHAQPIHLADACSRQVHQQRALFDHFPYARLDQVVAFQSSRRSRAHVRRAHHIFPAAAAV